MTILLIKHRIARHARAAEDAKAQGEYEAFWRERRAMLLAQADLWQATHEPRQEAAPCSP